jgi:hypothetical protein
MGSGPSINDDKTGEVEMRSVTSRNGVGEFERNRRDRKVHRPVVATSYLRRANGGALSLMIVPLSISMNVNVVNLKALAG